MAEKTDTVRFTVKGQVVIPNWLRKQFGIEDGTRAMVQATDDGILLKPVTAALIRKGRGILKRAQGPPSPADAFKKEWMKQKSEEYEIEDRHAG